VRLAPNIALASVLALAGSVEPTRALEREQLAVTRVTAPIRLDGFLDEPDWQRAMSITGFRLVEVREGEAPVESTSVRVLVDDTHLYFGIRCENRGPGPVRASFVPRDQVTDQDHVAIHIDTYRDFHRAYIFGVNPFGVQLDGILVGNDADFSWDAVWDAETHRDAKGWTVEMAIPLRSLRFPAHGDGRWGFWVRRQIQKADEVCSWPLWKQSEPGDVMMQAADLTGLGEARGGGALEVQPYVASARSDSRGPLDAPFAGMLSPWSHATLSQAGVDLKYGLTATLGANLTVNPDFSQIEADALQIDVNRRFPLFYAEKRPFFLDGAEVFQTPLSLVYTRRIADPDAGAKMIGTLGRMRLGVIAVRDAGGAGLEGVGGVPIEGVAARGTFGIARAALDLGPNSSVGVLFAGHESDGREQGTRLAAFIPGAIANGSDNLVAALDAKLRLSHALFFTGQLATSRTRVDSVNVADWTPPGRLDAAGTAWTSRFAYGDGIRSVSLSHEDETPNFRAETGFLSRVDQRRTALNGNVVVRPENAWLRSWTPIFESHLLHDHTGTMQEWRVSPQMEFAFQKQTGALASFARSRERWQGRLYDERRYLLDLSNSQWAPLDLSVGIQMGDGIYYGDADSTSFLGWLESWSFSATVRPIPPLTSEVTANRNRFSRSRVHGERYDIWVFGARTTWQFTRRLYVRLYPQVDTDAHHFDADGLVGYVIHPGSVAYVGVNGGFDRVLGHSRATTHTAFCKFSYAFQR
jgi:Domain of unknown function (DUF5916)/Carbohydrate family 9 binding domain-like